MPTIAVVDDRKDQRETLRRMIKAHLSGEWTCRDYPPLRSLDEYPHLLHTDEVAVLMLDERLHEQGGEEAADYSGHDIVRFLRERLPEFPIFVVTSHAGDEELQAAFGEVEDVIVRETFYGRPEDYVKRVVRSASKFLSHFEDELALVSNLSAKIAAGAASVQEVEELKAAQVKLGLAFGVDEFVDRAQWIEEMRSVADDLAQLRSDLLETEDED